MTNTYTDDINPQDFRYKADVKSVSDVKTAGRKTGETTTTHHTGILLMKAKPMRGMEKQEGMQEVGIEKNTWIVRNANRLISQKMFFEITAAPYTNEVGNIHYIKNVFNYRGLPHFYGIDTEKRDNE
jgi:hypothetical protein